MTRVTDDQLIQRSKVAGLKIIEAKANFWIGLSALAMLGFLGGVVVLIALGFKLVFG